ncbi:strawberry notch C-terminal domain-containing protein [Dinghuibacter silviterrae]|uniref:NTP hydrolase family protein n=1 Tax=Dinghuibacter silviterrae TaxID=1539049 RepID=A0A4R8DT71_9BACT|nr:strawberry notch C-terminal domain-containing protein [Dinghuibacter silviterrae]TDX01492.1 NTP hydrolase family protein [Dinghuibacter silviterrae]
MVERAAHFSAEVEQALVEQKVYNKLSLEKLAASFGIADKTQVKELAELAIVRRARVLAHEPGTVRERFDRIVNLYQLQVNLSHRTSQSILLQQYSTPAPIGYLAGVFCGVDRPAYRSLYFEPSAGNGLLTIAGRPADFIVNEIDPFRNQNLRTQGFREVWQRDATQPFHGKEGVFKAVITNPPFGKLDKPVYYETFPIRTLEQLMALRGLDTMAAGGRAAIIIGGHTRWDDKGRVQAGRNRIFFNYLYSRYHVADVINIDGHRLYSRQGTAFDVRLILIDGRKQLPRGNAPVRDKRRDVIVRSYDELFERISPYVDMKRKVKDRRTLEAEALALELELMALSQELGAPYEPASNACVVLHTQVPDSMSFETQTAVAQIKREVGGDMDNFVRHRLKYPSKATLCRALSAEQIDAVAMAIYNIEARNQGMIIGDQTGIGKGRVAAAMIRYGVWQGVKPVFLTEKANLFSDIYRDLAAIGSGHLKPFIVNGREPKTDIKDEDGNVVYQAPPLPEQQAVIAAGDIPPGYDFVVGTYSQFNSKDKKPLKPGFLASIAGGNIFIMDEAHNASGSSNTGEFLQGVAARTKGVVFLSATFAKRPDNMPIYAMKTSIADCNMSKDELVDAIKRGGVAMQEVLASQLVAEGQMIRRERSFEGIEVNYITLEEKAPEHRAIADNITAILRDIIAFQGEYVDSAVKQLDKIAVAEGKEVGLREGTSQAGVDNQPYFSKVFQVINQMLFSLKATAVAERAIQRLREGKKPVIAFASTMGSFIETLENDQGLPVSEGDTIDADFSEVLRRGLEGVMRYTEKDVDGNPMYKKFSISDFSPQAQADYNHIQENILTVATGITISPIDVIVKMIREAGYSVAEVTGRKFELQLNKKGSKALVMTRKRVNTNDAFRQFNNNEVDVLMINQSGSTGASAHAIPTAKVPDGQVKQRVMIVLQAELDISTEVQKRGRINRTGQILKPIYDYLISAIPAEKRLMMMLQKKLKSLDANTTSNQKQSSKVLDVPDFLNKYGDKVVEEYLVENPEVNKLLDDPLHIGRAEADSGSGDPSYVEDAAMKVSGRVAVLSTRMQEDFYNEVVARYDDYVDYLRQVGSYDLEVETMNLETETVSSKVIVMGKGGDSAFGNDSILETVRANVLKKPFTRPELENLLAESLKGKDARQVQDILLEEYHQSVEKRLEDEKDEVNNKYDTLIESISDEKNIQRIREREGEAAWVEATREREKELNEAREAKMKNLEKIAANRQQYLERIFSFYWTSRPLRYPVETFQSGNELVPAVFLGFLIDAKKKNPYAPSAIKLCFGIASSAKYLAIPASFSERINAIIGVSADLPKVDLPAFLEEWESYTKENNMDRKIRHVITGNLLQAFGKGRGKLVSYSTIDGQVKKGILLPENWQADEKEVDQVIVPIVKALPIINSLVEGKGIVTNNEVSLIRSRGDFKMIVPASRARGGDVYLDKDILKLVEGNNFEKVSDRMVAVLPEQNLSKAVEILQAVHGSSIALRSSEAGKLGTGHVRYHDRKPIEPPPPEDSDKSKRLHLLELKAKALALELELLSLAA